MKLWRNEKSLMEALFGNILVNEHSLENCESGYKILANSPESFFIKNLLVPPNRFRPENKLGDQTFLHGQTIILSKVLQLNQNIKDALVQKDKKPD